MKRRIIIPSLALLLMVGVLYIGSSFSPSVSPEPGVVVQKGPLTVWTTYDGKIEARHVQTVMSRFKGSATIVDLAPEGSPVQEGDLLVRFDCSAVERELLQLERDYALAHAELEGLEHAVLPLERRELRLAYLEAQGEYEAEKSYLDDSIQLMEEELVSPQEVEQQRLKVKRLRDRLDQLDMQREVTATYLHPTRLESARAKLASAEQALALAREQLNNCTVYAPAEGVVVYKPMYINREFRTVRVGDTLYKNQVFLEIPDMKDLVVYCQVPEAELSRVAPGMPVLVEPLAFPQLQLRGRVEKVSAMAQNVPGRQKWQKYFLARIALGEGDDRLRIGLSVRAKVRTYSADDALLVPRAAVWWENGEPRCRVRNGRQSRTRVLQLGRANLTHYEVLQGLQENELVVYP